MKRLIRHTLLFIIPVALVLIFLPVDHRMAYQGLEEDCFDHGLWIHDRIFEQKKGIDLLFLGSSHTINAIDDQLVEAETALSTANLGYCRLGRNLHEFLLEEVLERHQPEILILEIRETEDEHSHPIFPYLAATSEVLLPDFVWNRDYLDDVQTHLRYKLDLFQDLLWQTEGLPIRQEAFGFSVNTDTAEPFVLREFQSRKKKTDSTSLDGLTMNFPKASLKRIVNTCRDHQIRLVLLYLPSFGTYPDPSLPRFYAELAPVIIPPDRILGNPSFWHDPQHLNKAGATSLSTWVANQLTELF